MFVALNAREAILLRAKKKRMLRAQKLAKQIDDPVIATETTTSATYVDDENDEDFDLDGLLDDFDATGTLSLFYTFLLKAYSFNASTVSYLFPQ